MRETEEDAQVPVVLRLERANAERAWAVLWIWLLGSDERRWGLPGEERTQPEPQGQGLDIDHD